MGLVIAVLFVIALCISFWVNEGPLWRSVMLKQISLKAIAPYYQTPEAPLHVVHGFATVRRWSRSDPPIPGQSYWLFVFAPTEPYGIQRMWYVENGFLASEYEWGRNKVGRILILKATEWSFNGTIMLQIGEIRSRKESSPWWWDVQDQTEPTDPQWIAEHGKQ